MLDVSLPSADDEAASAAAAAGEAASEETASEETAPEQPGFAELGLPRPLVTALARQGIHSPFPIQSAAVPDVLAGSDVLGRGQTGSGKTLAFGLPLMANVAGDRAQPGRPRAIILVPTRELALQVHDALEPLGRGLSLRMKTVVGGMSMGRQIEALRRGVEVVVATPGRLTDLIQQGECSLADVQVSVLDEADHMCDLGFFPVVSALLEQTPVDGQRLLFSATLDGDVDKLVRRFLKNPVTHSIAPATSPVETMEHHVVQVSRDDKFPITASIANREGRTIIFVRTQHGVDKLVKSLARVGVQAGGLHGGKRQNQRTRILSEFREGAISVLVCTDVAARGIHVDDVSLVLHVDPPQDHKSYLHRGGRTARAGERGTVITLVLPNERRSTDALTRRAGIHPFRLKAAPGHPRLAEVAGAQEPSGEPVPVWEPPLRTPARGRRRDGRDGGFGGERRPRRFHGDSSGERDSRPRYDDDRPRRSHRGDGGFRRDGEGRPARSGPREGRPFGEGRPFHDRDNSEGGRDQGFDRGFDGGRDREGGRDRGGFSGFRGERGPRFGSRDNGGRERSGSESGGFRRERGDFDGRDRAERPDSGSGEFRRDRGFEGRGYENRGHQGGRGYEGRGDRQGGGSDRGQRYGRDGGGREHTGDFHRDRGENHQDRGRADWSNRGGAFRASPNGRSGSRGNGGGNRRFGR
ncbi:DEAD/DEAH box helicase [Sinosporangium album]|nr:DEAD/DEAH box helicase [Sinosporangium album]